MDYTKFKMKATPNFEKTEIYKTKVICANYPEYIERKEKTQTKTQQESQRETVAFVKKKGKKEKPLKVMGGIMAVILLFTGIYLSETEAPEYIENAILKMTEMKKEKDKSKKVQENEKVIGAKYLVENTDEENNTEKSVEHQVENTNFADSIKLLGTKTAESEKKTEETTEAKQVMAETGRAILREITAKDMSKAEDKIYCTNRTDIEIDINSYTDKEYPIAKISKTENKPKVLIIQTHGTEAYNDTGENGITRSNNTEKNVVKVGEELAKVLTNYGIPVIHSKTMHDEISYVKAYENSKAEVKEYLKNYPSIEYVIDVHRDAIGTEEKPVKTYKTINGESSAQLMFVIGTNASGGDHPNYEENLTTAVHIQAKAKELFPGLMRPVNIRPIIFNQNLAPGCMILEVGSDANTLNEALVAVRMIGRAIAEVARE